LVYISVILAESLSNCPVVQLPTVNVRNVGPSREHKHADVFTPRQHSLLCRALY